MFDIGWQEIFLIAVLALIIIGPKDLPRALKTITGVLRKFKGMARDFQSGLDDIVRETELSDMRKQIEAETGGDIRKRIEESIDPDGDIGRDLDEVRDVEGDMNAATRKFSDDVNKSADDDGASSPPPPEAVTETASSADDDTKKD